MKATVHRADGSLLQKEKPVRTPTKLILNLAAAGLLATAMACGGGGGGSSTETATINGSLDKPVTGASIHASSLDTGVNIVAVDENGNTGGSASNVTGDFTLTVPTGHDYVLIVSDDSGIISAVVYNATGDSEMQIAAGTQTVNLGTVVVDTANKTAEVSHATTVTVEVKDPAKTPTSIEPEKKIMGPDTDGDHIPDVVDKATGSDGTTQDMSHDRDNNGTQDVGDGTGQADPTESDSQGSGIAGDAATGTTLYTANCASCHGADAKGGVGPNIVGESAADVRDAIGEVSEMSGLSSLTGQEITDIGAYLQSLGSSSEGSESENGSEGGSNDGGANSSTGVSTSGATLYATNCAGCHGADAKGAAPSNNTSVVGEGANDIKEAIGEVSAMGSLSSLTDGQLADIAAWLADPSATDTTTGTGSGSGTTGGGTTSTTGQSVYTTNCLGCHGANGTQITGHSIVGKTADQISTAIANVAAMSSSSSLAALTTQEIADLATYLATL